MYLFAHGLEQVDVLCVMSVGAGLSHQGYDVAKFRVHCPDLGQFCCQVNASGTIGNKP